MILKKRLIGDALYEKLIFWALALMIISIPSSRFLMSVSQISLGFLWLAHGNYKVKIKAFLNNKAAVLMTCLFLLHVIGVFYSTDLDYALKDLKTKVPILIIPFMFASFPRLDAKKFETLLYLFVGSVISMSLYIAVKHFITLENVRELISREVISHIRFSLSVNLAIFFLIIMQLQKAAFTKVTLALVLALIWLVFFLLILNAFTGIVVFIVLMTTLILYSLYKTKSIYKKLIYSVVILFGFVGLSLYLFSFYKEYTTIEKLDLDNLDIKSALGNYYYHLPNGGIENGKYVYLYVQESELRNGWNTISDFDYDGYDKKGQKIRYTIIRYMTSLDLRKDQGGIARLSENDIENIENGIANVLYTKGIGIEARLLKILLEYENYIRTEDPTGHSVMQRVEYWKTAVHIIKKNFWFGVGTGDMNIVFKQEYENLDSKLDHTWRLRTHNQYLSIMVGFGFVGLLFFLFILFYPAYYSKTFANIYFLVFFVTFLVSMLTEDTIETQAGVTFYIYFYSLFVILRPRYLYNS